MAIATGRVCQLLQCPAIGGCDQQGGNLFGYEFAVFASSIAGLLLSPHDWFTSLETAGCITFVLGGARSGKSRFAERLAVDSGLSRHYIATSQAWDDEMRERITLHRMQRGDGWHTHEVPLRLAESIASISDSQNVILVDCLTLWVTNLMMAEADIDAEAELLIASLRDFPGRIIFVSNEVGLGIVPENRMARQFRDHAGRLHQRLAEVADEVFFIAAGLSLKMK